MKIITIPCAFDNYAYLLVCEESGSAVVIDPTEAYPVWRELESLPVTLTKVLCTHHHQDHVGGVEDLLSEQPELEVCGFHDDKERIPAMTRLLQDGDTVHVGRCSGQVLHTPGHTGGSVCYLFDQALFTGDTLFGAGCGRLFEGDAHQMHFALNVRIGNLPAETTLYCGHEYTEKNLLFAKSVEPENPVILDRLATVRRKRARDIPSVPFSLQLEKETNPFLRCGLAAVRKSFVNLAEDCSDVSVFSLLREARNNF